MAYTGSKAQAGRGAVLGIGPLFVPGAPAATPAYVTIGEIRTSGITNSQWDTVDVSNFESGVDKEFITTMRDPGMIAIAGNRISSDLGQVNCEAAFQSGGIYMFQILVPKNVTQTTTGDIYTFNALVKSIDFEIDVAKEISWTVKLQLSGPRLLTPGS
jgi:hypothetical protein